MTTWSAWPECGIGIVGGAVAAVDIDIVEDAELALQIEQLARERLGDTPALRIGKRPKAHADLPHGRPFRGIKHHPWKCSASASSSWPMPIIRTRAPPMSGPRKGWLISTSPICQKSPPRRRAHSLDEAYALLPESLRQRGFSAMSPAAEHLRSHSQVGTLPAIQAASGMAAQCELDYDSWMRVGMALKGALGEAGRDLFRTGQRRLQRMYPRPPPRRGRASNPIALALARSITSPWSAAGSLIASLRLDGSMACDGSIQRRGCCRGWMVILRRRSKPRRARRSRWRCPTGLVGDLTDYMLSTARRPQPLLSLGASLCAIGALMGRQYRTESNLRSNLYVVGIADSGSGKNHAREIINEVFFEAGLAHHLGGNKIASGAGLLTALHRQPAILFQIDEFGMFLAAAADRGAVRAISPKSSTT